MKDDISSFAHLCFRRQFLQNLADLLVRVTHYGVLRSDVYDRFVAELVKVEKKGEVPICKVLKKGMRSADRDAGDTKKRMIHRAAEALKVHVSDTQVISAKLSRILRDNGQVRHCP